MHRLQRIIIILLIIILSTGLTGCAYKSVDKRSFVVSIGVDPAQTEENGYRVTLKIAKPIASLRQAQKTEYAYLSTEAKTVSEAIRALETHNDKVVDFSQAKILAIHHELLGAELQEFMDFFTRRGDMQLIMYTVAAKPNAEEVLKVQPTLEAAGENSLYNFFDDTGTESPFVTTCFLFELRRDYMTNGKSAVMPIVQAAKDKNELIINTALVLKRNKPPVELNSTETKLYNTLMKGSHGNGYKAENSGYQLTLTYDRVKLKYFLDIQSGKKPRANLEVKAVGAINQSDKSLSLKRLNTYNEVANKELEAAIGNLLRKMQDEGVDPFGFGLRYRATRFQNSKTEAEWKAIYPDLTFNVRADVKLKSLGAVQ